VNRVATIVARDGTRWIVKSPQPGWYVPAIANGELVSGGRVIGELDVLGRRLRMTLPDVAGQASAVGDARAVGYGDVLLEIAQDTATTTATTRDDSAAPKPDARSLVFRAPTSGRFYARPSPDKPPYVAVGIELAPGATVCLLEVMKTFNRVTYGGAGLPARARVTELLVADGADVNAGDPLIALESI
jgi:acetyl-CoA carboxylase biotin carboxyl carrier protein